MSGARLARPRAHFSAGINRAIRLKFCATLAMWNPSLAPQADPFEAHGRLQVREEHLDLLTRVLTRVAGLFEQRCSSKLTSVVARRRPKRSPRRLREVGLRMRCGPSPAP